MKILAKLITDFGVLSAAWLLLSYIFTKDISVVIFYLGLIWPALLFLIFGPVLFYTEILKEKKSQKTLTHKLQKISEKTLEKQDAIFTQTIRKESKKEERLEDYFN